MIRDAMLAAGLLLSTASQLRMYGLPIGAGELLLLAWCAWTLVDKLTRSGAAVTPAFATVGWFWGIFAVVECSGLLNGLARGALYDPQWMLHDAMAYPLVGAVACATAAEPAARLRRVTCLVVGLGTVALALQCVAAAGIISIPFMEPWYWERLRGWSANPNQLAFLCTAISLLAAHLAATAAGIFRSIAAAACVALAVVVGRLTGSDTFTLTLIVAMVMSPMLALRFNVLQPAPRQAIRRPLSIVLLVGIPALVTAAVPLIVAERAATSELESGILKNGGKDAAAEADLRLALWQQAIERGVDAGMLGLGPGPHLAIPELLVAARESEAGQPGNIEHPQQTGAPNFEAHNTMLDLFVQGGLIADLAIVWLLGVALLAAYRARSAGLMTLLCGITLFGMTNLIMRQPLFWFSIALCLAQAPRRRGVAAHSMAPTDGLRAWQLDGAQGDTAVCKGLTTNHA